MAGSEARIRQLQTVAERSGFAPTRALWAAQVLRRAILTGQLHPGDPLVTTTLAEQLSISPTPLREALRLLVAEGLVEMSPQKTARVASVSLRTFAEICEIRLQLEPFALRRSLSRRSPDWFRQVEESLQSLRETASDPDPFAFERAHDSFHRSLLLACGSEQLLHSIATLTDQSRRQRLLSWAARGGTDHVVEEHMDLFETCAGSGVEEAVAELERHLLRTLALVLEVGDAPEVMTGLTGITDLLDRDTPLKPS